MTRTPADWRDQAQTTVEETVDDIFADMNRHDEQVYTGCEDLRGLSLTEDPDKDDLRDATDALVDALKALADDAYDHAYAVHKLKSGSTLRNLRGKEPVGYSKNDGGAAHDAVYGSKAQSASYVRHIVWPLNLSDWEKKTAPHARHGTGTLTVTGTTRYKKRVGGVDVYLVKDGRSRKPPI